MDNLEFETLTSAEFKEYIRTHKEKNYLVIDMRQHFCLSPRPKKPICAP